MELKNNKNLKEKIIGFLFCNDKFFHVFLYFNVKPHIAEFTVVFLNFKFYEENQFSKVLKENQF